MSAGLADRPFLPRENFRDQVARSEAERWTRVLRSQSVDELLKAAAPGQSGDDEVAFEQAMSNLAHSYLRNRAPGLQDYELGFQMLEHGKDNERATGVFGFKVGEQLLLAPRFFREGELKGNELLYLKESDTFVPMTEEWVNYLLGRKPVVLGEPMRPNISPLSIGRPDLRPLWQSPLKYSSDWSQEAVKDLAGAADILKEGQTNYTLELVKQSSEAAMRFVSMLDAYPHLVEPYVQILGAGVIKAALDSAARYETLVPNKPEPSGRQIVTGSIFREKAAAPAKPSQLQIIMRDETAPAGLTEKEASQLLLDGYLIRDARDETSEAFDETSIQRLQNPARTGVYDVLVKPDDFKRCLVVYRPRTSGYCPGDTGSVVVDLDDKSWVVGRSEDIFVDGECEHEKEFRDWFDDAKSVGPDTSGVFVAVGPNGEGLGPFRFKHSLPSSDGEKCFEVMWVSSYTENSYNVSRQGTATGRKETSNELSFGRISGERLVQQKNIFYVPDSWKMVRLGAEDDSYPSSPGEPNRSKQQPLRLGNMTDVELGVYKKLAALAVWSDGLEAVINDRRFPNKAGYLHLIREHGFSQKDAAEILQLAERKRGLKLRVKYADLSQVSNSMNDYGPAPFPSYVSTMDSTMGSTYPAYPKQVDYVQMMNMQPQNTRRLEPPGPDVLGSVNQAVQSGQRDILDVGTMGALLKTTRDENLIDKQIGNLVKGMDGLGRLIFNMYQNPDVFEDRYGKDDVPELEDKMLSCFEDIGDIVLDLRQRSINPTPGLDLNHDDNLSTRG